MQKANRALAESDAAQARKERTLLTAELTAVTTSLEELRPEIRQLRQTQNGKAIVEAQERLD